MPFRFRLEKVLKVRQRLLEQCTRDVAAAERARQACLAREVELAAAYRLLADSDPTPSGAALDVRDLADHAVQVRRLGELRVDAVQRTRLATAFLDQQRLRLNAAWRDVEVLRKLEERRREQWDEEQRRAEGRRLDEVGGLRADRQRRSKVSA